MAGSLHKNTGRIQYFPFHRIIKSRDFTIRRKYFNPSFYIWKKPQVYRKEDFPTVTQLFEYRPRVRRMRGFLTAFSHHVCSLLTATPTIWMLRLQTQAYNSSNYFLKLSLFVLYACVCMCICVCLWILTVCVQVRGPAAGVGSLLPLYGPWGTNWGHRAGKRVLPSLTDLINPTFQFLVSEFNRSSQLHWSEQHLSCKLLVRPCMFCFILVFLSLSNNWRTESSKRSHHIILLL